LKLHRKENNFISYCRGFGLVEVMIGIGVGAIILLVGAQSIVLIGKTQKQMDNLDSVKGISFLISKIAMNQAVRVRVENYRWDRTFILNNQNYSTTTSSPSMPVTTLLATTFAAKSSSWIDAKISIRPTANYLFYNDSHAFADTQLIPPKENETSTMFKQVTKALIISRCVQNQKNNFGPELSSIDANSPGSSAYYVLEILARVPFVQLANNVASVRCCPRTNVSCTDGGLNSWSPRTFRIQLNLLDATLGTYGVSGIQDFPVPGELDAVYGAGVLLAFNRYPAATIYNNKFFIIENRCQSRRLGSANCLSTKIDQAWLKPTEFATALVNLKTQSRTWVGGADGGIAGTGFIRLGK